MRFASATHAAFAEAVNASQSMDGLMSIFTDSPNRQQVAKRASRLRDKGWDVKTFYDGDTVVGTFITLKGGPHLTHKQRRMVRIHAPGARYLVWDPNAQVHHVFDQNGQYEKTRKAAV